MEPDRTPEHVNHMREFHRIMAELEQLHVEKIEGYGLGRYTGDLAFNLQAAFYDVDRKYIRLRHQLTNSRRARYPDVRESFRDISLYGVMGMQILDLMKEEH